MKKHINKRKVGDEVVMPNKQYGIITRISNGKARVEMGDTMQIVPLSELSEEPTIQEQPVELEKPITFQGDLAAPIPPTMTNQQDKLRFMEHWRNRHSKVQPASEELGNEIDRFRETEEYLLAKKAGETDVVIARHFSEWGAEHYLKSEFLTKFAEMTGSIDTMPKNTLPPSKECEKGLREPLVSDGLEEEIKRVWKTFFFEEGGIIYDELEILARHFTQWQKEQMMKDGLDAVKSGQFNKIEKTIAGVFVKYGMDKQRETMLKEAVEGWVAVDSDTEGNRRVTFFPKEPVRDLLTEYKYWAATRPNYESVRLNPNAFPNLKWEDEPKKVKLIIVKED